LNNDIARPTPSLNMHSLSGQNIILMGGTTGLGLSAAKKLVAAGARVVVSSRSQVNVDAALAALGPNARGFAADAATPEAAERAVELAVGEFGKVDALYHVAGGSGRSRGDGPLHEMTDDGLRYTLDLNLNSVIYSNRAVIRQFLKQGSGGVILNMASVLGYSPSAQFFASHAYAAAKAGIIGFSKSIAAYYAPQNIRVNVIAPALVETPMSQRAVSNENIMNFVKTKQPLDGGRIGQPEDCDAAALLLLSPDSQFITGQVLAVDGGWTVSEGQLQAS
jgi:NAD(P)-dependent dehydrogenase (short-subunit alcohol dehydrogenase family)